MLRFRRPSPALVIACVALFVAMGGTGYAALKLPKNSVKAKQLAPRSVGSSEAHNLTAKDFKKSARAKLRGPRGERGPAGPAGPAGGAGGAGALRLVGPPASSDGACAVNNPPPVGEFCIAEDQGSWANYGNGYAPAAFSRDASGLVRLQGSVAGSDGGNGIDQFAVFHLPAGYRPAQNRRFAASVNGAAGWVDVLTNGAVVSSAWPATLLSLDGIAFRP